MRIMICALLILVLLSGCGPNPSTPAIIDTSDTTSQKSPDSGHSSWGTWSINIDPENLTAQAELIRQPRELNYHINVTSWLQPPACEDCIEIKVIAFDPVERIADVTMVLKNPTTLGAYDVKAIISDYGTKEFLNPDAFADFYTDGTTWDPFYVFATDAEDNYFGGSASHAVAFNVRFPHGASTSAKVTVDVSWPEPQDEPWRIDNIVVAGPLQNNDSNYISFTAHIRDHQDNVQVVFVDMSPVGPTNAPMGDDSLHKDYLPDDGIWGLDDITTNAAPGPYDVWIRAGAAGAEHLTYQKVTLEVILPVLNPPPLYIVSMMQAEDDDFYLNETTFTSYADTLRLLKNVFDFHGGKIALQPDWTFIQGASLYDPTLLTDFQAAGHGVDTHASETDFDLGYVHDQLESMGVIDTIIASGGFDKTLGDNGNWAAYVSNFTVGGVGGPMMFQASVAYRDPSTLAIDSHCTPIRPSLTGDWMINDPGGPLVYIPGAPDNGATGAHPNFFSLLGPAVDYAIRGVIPGKVNCFYWNDQVSNYSGSPLSMARLNFWDQLFKDYFNKKVNDGDIIWANFNEMNQIYLEWEDDQ